MVDDYVPYSKAKGQPAFCSTYSTNIWAMLLEKAFAKLNGSYEDIIRGKATEALGFLLPYSVKYYDHFEDTKDQLEKIWKKISKRSTSGSTAAKKSARKSTLVATCATGKSVKKQERKQECEDVGLNFKHAYCILDSFILKKGQFGLAKDCRLLKIKNPKVQKWKGDWCNDSPLWTEEIRQFVGFNGDDKGELFITFEDYCAYFYKTTICFYQPKLRYNNLVLAHERGKSCLVRFEVRKECTLHFKLVQLQRCLFPRSFRYRVARTHFVVGRLLKPKARLPGGAADDVKFV